MHHRPTAFSSVASTTRPTSTLIDRFSTTANSMYAPPTRRAVRGRKTTMAPLRLLNASHVKTIFAVINASISNLTTRIAAHVVENARVERLVENPNASAHQTSFSAIIIASIPKQIINFVAQAVHVKAIIAVRHAGEIKSAWIDGECRKGGKCYATKCDTSKSHVYNGTCEENDNDHCGAHNSPCSSEEVCKSGVCARFCNTNETICEVNGNRSCRNLNTDRDHCGQCNKACIKSDLAGIVTCENTKCIEGNCKLGSHFNENTNRCEPDTDLACGDKLINCNNAIPNSEETFCESAVCKLKRCKDGFHVDTSKQKCVEDTVLCCGPHCLRCLNPSYGKAVCKNGKCDVECNDGYTRCETPSPRCTNLNEASACGSCTNQCTEKPANATAVCINKTCSFKCDPGYAECTSGQCVSTNTTSHCGTCNNRCLLVPNGSSSCDNGKCIITCNSGYFLKKNQCVPIGSGCPGTFIDCNLDGSRCCKTFEDCNNSTVACLEVAPLEPIQP